VLAEAITAAAGGQVAIADALRSAARAAGRELGEDANGSVSDVLARGGYEPRAAGERIVLANCPFHSLARRYTELVCAMNLDLVDGLLGAVGADGLRARLDPGPDRCCVTIGPAPA
jgi:predicted ArsR family transcriptional regulator